MVRYDEQNAAERVDSYIRFYSSEVKRIGGDKVGMHELWVEDPARYNLCENYRGFVERLESIKAVM